jgi:hypothetical protein
LTPLTARVAAQSPDTPPASWKEGLHRGSLPWERSDLIKHSHALIIGLKEVRLNRSIGGLRAETCLGAPSMRHEGIAMPRAVTPMDDSH